MIIDELKIKTGLLGNFIFFKEKVEIIVSLRRLFNQNQDLAHFLFNQDTRNFFQISVDKYENGIKSINSSLPVECIYDSTNENYSFKEYSVFDGDEYTRITLANFNTNEYRFWRVINGLENLCKIANSCD